MIFIVYDIEATCWEGRPPGMVQETLEIGAYRLDRFGNLHSSFQRLIKPILHPQMSLFCKQLTGIDQLEINQAKTFDRIAEEFVQWSGFLEEPDVVMASWGRFDFRQLRKDCALHQIEDDWLDYCIDLKDQYRSIRGLGKAKGLKSVVEREGFDWIGEEHRALDDAANTVQIFRKLLDEWVF